MAANAQLYQTTTVGAASPAFAAEAVIATIPSVSVDAYGGIVRIDAMIILTPGADTSVVVLRIRRNSVTGTVIGGPTTYPVVPATPYPVNVTGIAAEPVGVHNYVVTIVQTDASANAAVASVVAVAQVGN